MSVAGISFNKLYSDGDLSACFLQGFSCAAKSELIGISAYQFKKKNIFVKMIKLPIKYLKKFFD